MSLVIDRNHLNGFCEYSSRFIAVGGPDPHVKIIAKCADELPEEDALWLVACYIAVYTIGGAAALFHFTRDRDIIYNHRRLIDLLATHRQGFPMRRERRAVWNPEKLARCIQSLNTWALSLTPERLQSMSYPELWDTTKPIAFFGRYARMKFLGTLEHAFLIEAGQPDIRPRGAWSPRRTLALLVPSEADALDDKSTRPRVIDRVDGIAEDVRLAAADGLGVHPNHFPYFVFETLLCNYRQALGPKGKYIGGSHDNELTYWKKARDYWFEVSSSGPQVEVINIHDTLPFFDIRKTLFFPQCLSELSPCRNRWNGSRKDLDGVYHRYGYWWTDLAYDYCRTTDLENPQPWA